MSENRRGMRPEPLGTAEKDTGVLAVDVGNTSTHLGVFAGDELLGTFELTTPTRITPDEARMQLRHALDFLGLETPGAAILSCVVPPLADAWTAALDHGCIRRALVVGPGLRTGLRMSYDDPGEVGGDRVADAVAARTTYGCPVVVVDLGTTTNFEVIDGAGTFVGGIIAPGAALGAATLAKAAARLPAIELRAPRSAIGRNTRAAMQAGVVLGEAARIDGLLDMVLAELRDKAPAEKGGWAADAAAGTAGGVPIVLTGNFADGLRPLLRHHVVVDDTLTLRGLNLLWQANRR